MGRVRTLLSIVTGICTIGGFAIALLEYAGVGFNGFMDALAASSRFWLPVVSLLFGLSLGLAIGDRRARSRLMADIESERDRCRKLEAVIAHNRGCEVKWQEYRALAMWARGHIDSVLWKENFDERQAAIDGHWDAKSPVLDDDGAIR